MMVNEVNPKNPLGYEILRRLSFSSYLYLSRECASGRLIILKYFFANERALFEREAQSLAELENFEGAPTLSFALEIPENQELPFCLGIQYLQGKTLLELKSEKTASTWTSAHATQLKTLLHSLHHEQGRTHGDLSPKNVLVRSSDGRVFLLDWEFSEKISDQNISSFESFRGTEGFSSLDQKASLIQKDLQALEACLKYGGVLVHASKSEGETSLLKRWFKEKQK